MSSLFELRDRVLMLPTLESSLLSLLNEIEKAQFEVSSLLGQYKQESRDVERIQKESFSSFLLKLTGKYADKLDKERREEIHAKLAYDRAVTHLNSLMHEKDELSGRIFDLQVEKQTYQTELTNRRQKITCQLLTEQKNIQYVKLENERNDIIS
ncbi:MAG: hypothetical protein LBH62_01710 [Nitrososphaerota archaeon]|jgi:hypothetical protein|nr:hypothetical protein [Nitrososphaerota archaeon]